MATKKVSKAAKRVVKQKRVRPVSSASLPEGYKVIERAPNWDHEANPIINGVRSEAKELTFGRGTSNEYDAECFVVTDKDIGDVAVWKSGGLAALFEETNEGDEVYIEFLGYGEAKDDQSPPKLFRCASRPGKKNRNPF